MENQTREGVVVFLKANEGSKSECSLPYLYLGRDVPLLPLFVVNDNPFENGGLAIYDGVRVKVVGNVDKNNVFIVSEIETI